MDRTVYFHYCTAFPIIRTVLIFLGTFQLYVPYNLKKKSCNIYKYRTYNRHLRVPMDKSTKHLPRESLGDSYNSVGDRQ